MTDLNNTCEIKIDPYGSYNYDVLRAPVLTKQPKKLKKPKKPNFDIINLYVLSLIHI